MICPNTGYSHIDNWSHNTNETVTRIQETVGGITENWIQSQRTVVTVTRIILAVHTVTGYSHGGSLEQIRVDSIYSHRVN